jgi:hypothetical protein
MVELISIFFLAVYGTHNLGLILKFILPKKIFSFMYKNHMTLREVIFRGI